MIIVILALGSLMANIGWLGVRLNKQSKRIQLLDRKLNALLSAMGIDPKNAQSSNPVYQKIADLYSQGKIEEAKAMAKSELTEPAEIKKAWQVCQEQKKQDAQQRHQEKKMENR